MSIDWILIKKEYSLMRMLLISYGSLLAFSLLVLAMPHEAAGHIGSILQVTALIAFYCHLTVKAIVIERRQNSHRLMLTLPISAFRLKLMKLVSLWLIFFTLYVPALIISLLIIVNSPGWPAAGPAYYSFSFALYLPAFALILAVAFGTYSEGLTILALVISNVSVSIAHKFFPNTTAMINAFEAGTIREAGIVWPSEISTVILYAVISLLILTVTTLALLKRNVT